MDKIKLSTADIEYILKWRDEHQYLVRSAPSPIKAIKLEFPDTNIIVTAIREKNVLTCIVNHNGLSMGKIVFKLIAFGRWSLAANKTKLDSEDIQGILTVYGSTMAFLVYGNEAADTEIIESTDVFDKPEKPVKKSSGQKKQKKPESITYILHRGKTTGLRPTGSHSKITHEFSVRGHFRHYKSGKVVWITEYRKGTGKKHRKTYKIGTIDKPTE